MQIRKIKKEKRLVITGVVSSKWGQKFQKWIKSERKIIFFWSIPYWIYVIISFTLYYISLSLSLMINCLIQTNILITTQSLYISDKLDSPCHYPLISQYNSIPVSLSPFLVYQSLTQIRLQHHIFCIPFSIRLIHFHFFWFSFLSLNNNNKTKKNR